MHPASASTRPNSGLPDVRRPLPWPLLPGAPKRLSPLSRTGVVRSRRDPPLAGLRLRARPPKGSAPLTFLLCLLFLLLFGGAAAAAAAAAATAGLGRPRPRAPHGCVAQWRRAAGRAAVGRAAAAGLGRGELARRRQAAGRLAAARADSSGGLHGCAAGGTIAVASRSLSRTRSAAGGEVTDGGEAAGRPRRGGEKGRREGERGGEKERSAE